MSKQLSDRELKIGSTLYVITVGPPSFVWKHEADGTGDLYHHDEIDKLPAKVRKRVGKLEAVYHKAQKDKKANNG